MLGTRAFFYWSGLTILLGVCLTIIRCYYDHEFLKKWITIKHPGQWQWWVLHTIPHMVAAIVFPSKLGLYILRVLIIEFSLMVSHYCGIELYSLLQVGLGASTSASVYAIVDRLWRRA